MFSLALLLATCLAPSQDANLDFINHNPPVLGVALHLCSCAAPCGCMFTGRDADDCHLTSVYHVTNGGYVSRHVKGLTIVVVTRPKELGGKGKPDTVWYLPTGLTAEQDSALQFILGEHVSRYEWGTHVVRHVPIDFRMTPKGYSVHIPGVLEAATEAMPGVDKKPLVVDNVAFQEGRRWTLGKTTKHTYRDVDEKAWNWDYSGRNGAWCNFKFDWIDHP